MGSLRDPKYLDHSRYIPAVREATITQPSVHVYSILGLSRGSELIHNEKRFTALAYSRG